MNLSMSCLQGSDFTRRQIQYTFRYVTEVMNIEERLCPFHTFTASSLLGRWTLLAFHYNLNFAGTVKATSPQTSHLSLNNEFLIKSKLWHTTTSEPAFAQYPDIS